MVTGQKSSSCKFSPGGKNYTTASTWRIIRRYDDPYPSRLTFNLSMAARRLQLVNAHLQRPASPSNCPTRSQPCTVSVRITSDSCYPAVQANFALMHRYSIIFLIFPGRNVAVPNHYPRAGHIPWSTSSRCSRAAQLSRAHHPVVDDDKRSVRIIYNYKICDPYTHVHGGEWQSETKNKSSGSILGACLSISLSQNSLHLIYIGYRWCTMPIYMCI